MNNIYLHVIGSKNFSNLLSELDFNCKISTDKNIKHENKDLFVRVIFVENLLLIEIKKIFLENIPTIFFIHNKDYLKKNKLDLLQFHISLSLPVDILSFREILNILLTKYNFFKKSKIIINDYEVDSNQRVIIKNKKKVKLTEKELELILTLNKKNGLEKSFLLKKIWNHNSDLESHAFETHLHRLRKKMTKIFNDKRFIMEKNSLYYISE
jgi:hypothetical protein